MDQGGQAGAAAAVLATQGAVQKLVEAVQQGSILNLNAARKGLEGGKQGLQGVRDKFGRGLLHYAAQFAQPQMVEHLVKQLGFRLDDQDSAGETPLALAAATDSITALKLLLSLGADPALRGGSTATAPIHRAAGAGEATGSTPSGCLAALLDDTRVDVNTPSGTGTPLCWAAGAGHAANVQRLIAAGADANDRGSGADAMPALSLAAGAGCEAAVAALLAAGAVPSATGGGGATALHVAAAVPGKEEQACRIVDHLLKAGADADAKDQAGFTPMEVALASGNVRVAAALLPATRPLPGVEPWDLSQLMARVRTAVEQQAADSSAGPGGPAVKPGAVGTTIVIPEPTEPNAELAASAKRKGDVAFVAQDYSSALDAYTQALQHDTRTAATWANRAAAYLRLGKPQEALADARMSRALDPSYAKAWYREGAAYEMMQQWEDAAAAFYEGCSVAPGNQDLEVAFKRAIAAGRQAYVAAQAATRKAG